MYVRSQTWLETGPAGRSCDGARVLTVPSVIVSRGGYRRRINPRGVGAVVNGQFVPANPGVDQATSDAACAMAGGQPQHAGVTPVGYPGAVANSVLGCTVPTTPDLPSWCALPMMASLFDTCNLAAANSQAQASGYTIYKTGQANPQLAQEFADESAAIDEASATNQDCAAWAAANYPALSSLVSPDFAAMVLNPFSNGCQSSGGFPGWLLYGGLAVGVLVLLKVI
jgi:hypothetical protein